MRMTTVRDAGIYAETLEDGGDLITVRGVINMPYPTYAIIRLINDCNDMEDPRYGGKTFEAPHWHSELH